jgi:hypothetical protein
MHILNYQHFVETRHKFTFSIRDHYPRPIALKKEFKPFSIACADGHVITLHQNGKIIEKPINGPEYAVRPPNEVSQYHVF